MVRFLKDIPGVITKALSLVGAGNTLGFFGVTEVARASAYTQTYATADKTHANATAASLTDNTGAAADNTVENVPASAGDAGGAATVSAAASVATVASVNTALTAIENNIADLADEVNKLITDLADLKQLVNAVIDDMQSYGLLQ